MKQIHRTSQKFHICLKSLLVCLPNSAPAFAFIVLKIPVIRASGFSTVNAEQRSYEV